MRSTLPSGTPVEIARPRSGGNGDGLVVAPDIGGLRPLFDELCSRLAEEQGWVVAAAEPFPGREGMTLEERMQAVAGLRDERQVGDLVAAADATGCERVRLIGFCMGGMYAFKGSATGRFAAAVSFYGMIRIPEGWRSPGQGEPLDALRGAGRCPVMAVVGGRDHYTPRDDVDELEKVGGVTVVRYPEAEHGFVHDPSRPAHRPDDAADAWNRALAFLRAH